jgi:hypothetical protein
MNTVETAIVDFIKRRNAEGALSASEADIMDAIVPHDRPKLRYNPSYKYALERLRVRLVINCVTAPDGITHYFIGNYASPELRASLGIYHGGQTLFLVQGGKNFAWRSEFLRIQLRGR